jgi:hypothetical protein
MTVRPVRFAGGHRRSFHQCGSKHETTVENFPRRLRNRTLADLGAQQPRWSIPPFVAAAQNGMVSIRYRARSNQYSLHLVERHLLGAAVVKLGRACRGMVRHPRGAFKRAAVFQIGGDARGAKGVVADARGYPGGFRAAGARSVKGTSWFIARSILQSNRRAEPRRC